MASLRANIKDLVGFVRYLQSRKDPCARFIRRYGEEYSAIASFKLVDGWLADTEAIQLFDLASRLSGNKVVAVELGSWLGKSAIVLSHALSMYSNASLYCIDPFDASGEPGSDQLYEERKSELSVPLHKQFEANIKKYGRFEIVRILRGYSFEFSPTWEQPVDFLFIDASHDYESVLQDFNEWGSFLKPGGYIAIHDVRLDRRTLTVSGPGRVVRESLLNNGAWGEQTLVASLFSAKKLK